MGEGGRMGEGNENSELFYVVKFICQETNIATLRRGKHVVKTHHGVA